jgi:hypothetical protein
MIDVPEVQCRTVLACSAGDYSRSPTFAATYLAIENSSKNNLGRALPAGRVRVIRNSEATSPLVADEILPALAAEDLMLVRIGQPSQVSVKREIVERLDAEKATVHEIIHLTLGNRSEQAQKILLAEPRPAASAQVIEKSDEFQIQSQLLLFAVDVPAGGQKSVSYTVRRVAQ